MYTESEGGECGRFSGPSTLLIQGYRPDQQAVLFGCSWEVMPHMQMCWGDSDRKDLSAMVELEQNQEEKLR